MKRHVRLTESDLNRIVKDTIKSVLNESINANDIFKEVKEDLWKLFEYGQMEVVFGDYIGQTFNVYIKSESEIEVEYFGDKLKMECKNFNNEDYVARIIMHLFSRLYLKK